MSRLDRHPRARSASEAARSCSPWSRASASARKLLVLEDGETLGDGARRARRARSSTSSSAGAQQPDRRARRARGCSPRSTHRRRACSSTAPSTPPRRSVAARSCSAGTAIVADARPKFCTPRADPVGRRADRRSGRRRRSTEIAPDHATAIVVLTHDDKFDVPALKRGARRPRRSTSARSARGATRSAAASGCSRPACPRRSSTGSRALRARPRRRQRSPRRRSRSSRRSSPSAGGRDGGRLADGQAAASTSRRPSRLPRPRDGRGNEIGYSVVVSPRVSRLSIRERSACRWASSPNRRRSSTWSPRTWRSSRSQAAAPSPRDRSGTPRSSTSCSATCPATSGGSGRPPVASEVVRDPSNKCNGMTYDADGNLSSASTRRAPSSASGRTATRETIASHFQGKELNSPNDVVVAVDGSIYFTDPWYGRMPGFGVERERELDFQGVYRIPPGGGELQLVAGRLRDAERPLLLAGQHAALHQRHAAGAHPRLRRSPPTARSRTAACSPRGSATASFEDGPRRTG